ncbi:MAG TPA: hypothetical protein VHM25_20900, partial [Polyangiaceae bacterium]|nr:hypothetical protein [Polyangiaceae bacterium]
MTLPRSTEQPSVPSATKNRSAAEIERLQKQVGCGCALLVAGFVGFRVAMEVYSGPSVPLAFTITAGVAVTSLLGFVY